MSSFQNNNEDEESKTLKRQEEQVEAEKEKSQKEKSAAEDPNEKEEEEEEVKTVKGLYDGGIVYIYIISTFQIILLKKLQGRKLTTQTLRPLPPRRIDSKEHFWNRYLLIVFYFE